jgi:hypothetical protein
MTVFELIDKLKELPPDALLLRGELEGYQPPLAATKVCSGPIRPYKQMVWGTYWMLATEGTVATAVGVWVE